MKRFTIRHRTLLSILVLGLAVVLFSTGQASANGACYRFASNENEYTFGGWHYRIVRVGISGAIPNPFGGSNAFFLAQSSYTDTYPLPHDDITQPNYFVVNDNQAYINSTTCNGISGEPNTYGGASAPGSDVINAGLPPFGWNDGAFGTIRPTQMGLGLAPKPVGDPSTTHSTLPGWRCLSTASTLGALASLFQCNSLDFSFDIPSNRNRSSAVVDDSGRLVIQSGASTNTIWCTELNTNAPRYPGFTPYPAVNCDPDIKNVDPPNGTGFMFRPDQTCLAALPGCASPLWSKWFTGTAAQPLYGSTSLTPIIAQDGAGYLQTFAAHYDARNTGTGGFGAENYFTLRYPTNAGACTSFSINGLTTNPVFVNPGSTMTLNGVFRNNGTRPWRASDGYNFNPVGPPGGAAAFPAGIINTGSSVTMNTTVTAPASGTIPVTWQLRQNGGVIATCSRQITVVSVGTPPVCGVLTPAQVSPGAPFTITLHVTYTGPPPVVNTFTILAAGTSPVLFAGPSRLIEVPLSKTQALGTATDDFRSTGLPPGSYTVSWTFSSPVSGSVVAPCTGTITVVNSFVPYMSVFGGDVFAGGGFTPTCSAGPSSGNIITKQNGAGTAGSGSQLAAFALGTINGFSSAKLRSAAPLPPFGLSFANTSAPPAGSFDSSNCINGYNIPTSGTAPPGGNLVNWPSGTYYVNAANYAIQLDGNPVFNGTHITLYVKGNLIIGNNIKYITTWGTPNDIPLLKFIVEGNIYIDKGVSELNGTYVAKPDSGGVGGIINTCTDMANPYGQTALLSGSIYTNCNNQLVVYGSFVAQRVNWLRIHGDTTKATPGENPFAANINCPGKITCSAEIVVNGPESYMTRSGLLDTSADTFDYVTSLPPVL